MFFIYRFLTTLFFPVLIIIIFVRIILKKEDKKRFKEKIFLTNKTVFDENKKNIIIWLHGASLGEISSIFPLISNLKKNNKNIKFLLTTVTLSSAKIVENKYKEDSDIIHQFFPVDTPFLIRKFLSKWKPDLVGFIDSEIWPNFIFEIKKKKIPLILINGRITKKTFDRWMFISFFAKKIFSSFDLCISSNKDSVEYLKLLGSKNIKNFGNLKFVSNTKTLGVHKEEVKISLKKRNVWCASNTHEGEEIFCMKTHIQIKEKIPDILTIIIPRHIERNKNIFTQAEKLGLTAQILNEEEPISNDSEILLINSFGVLSKYYKICNNIFMGKSVIKELAAVSGQNPIEAAKLGCKIFHGPYIYNFEEVYSFLKQLGISEEIETDNVLAKKIVDNLKNPKSSNKIGINKLENFGEIILDKITQEIKNFI